MAAAYREHEPVHWGGQVRPGVARCWYLTRHADVDALGRVLFVDGPASQDAVGKPLSMR